jgi:3-hydroxybutyryl-CoA dehydratase
MKIGDQFDIDFIVSDEIYGGFINVFKDRNPLHTQDEFAIKNGFKEKVMHGNILSGFLSYFIGECLPVKNVIIQTQEIKFMLPVYLGDNLIFSSKITGFFESVNTYEFMFYFQNKEGKKVARGKIQIGLLR